MRDTYRFIPYIIVSFFILLFTADAIFVYNATTTYSGSLEQVQRGNGIYNKAIQKPVIEKDESLQLVIKDPQYIQGTAVIIARIDTDIAPSSVLLKMMRPVTAKYDQSVKMTRQDSQTYRADVKCDAGQWDVEISVELAEQIHIIKKRIFLQAQND